MKNILLIVLVFLAVSVNAQWQQDVRLTFNDSVSNTSLSNAWCVAAKENVVHVVWYDRRDGNPEIYYKRSIDGGTSWGADTRLTNNTSWSSNPSVAVTGSLVHVLWYDRRDGNTEIYYKRSIDGGTNWGVDTRLTNNNGSSENPSVAAIENVVHVVWHDRRDGNPEIYYKRSIDGGTSWGADTRLTNNTFWSYNPSVAVSGSFLHVVWFDYRDGKFEIYYKCSTDGGTSWGVDTRLTNTSYSHASYPSVAVSGSLVHVVWYDHRDGNTEIYYKRSTDGGTSWGTDIRLTNNTSGSDYSSVAASGTFVHVVWQDFRTGGNYEIYYKLSTDGGTSWGEDTRLTNNTSYSMFPFIAVFGSLVHVIWQDEPNGYSGEIYYKRNPTGNVNTGINYISSEVPSSYALNQNYPNPFNSSTRIKFNVMRSPTKAFKSEPLRGFGDDNFLVVLKVYDITGKEVETLVNGRMQAGTYSVTFNGTGLSSGVYFYKLEAGKYMDVKRMVMVK